METKLEIKAVFIYINKYRIKYVKTLNKPKTKPVLQATGYNVCFPRNMKVLELW